MTTGWMIGYVIGGVIVALVVTLLTTLIVTTRKIGTQAKEIESDLATAQTRTEALWRVAELNVLVGSITDRLARARSILGGQR